MMHPLTRQLADLLCMRLDFPEAISARQWEDLLRVARTAGIIAKLHHLLTLQGKLERLAPYARRHFYSANALACRQKRQVQFEAATLSKLLEKVEKDKLVFLKGAGYVLSGNAVAEGRLFSDIDVLVGKAYLPAVERKLMLYGWFSKGADDYDQYYYRQWAHEIPPLRHAGRGTVLDVHHNLVPPVSGKAPAMSAFNEHIKCTEQGYQVFSLQAMTLHSLIHLFFQEDFSHGFRDLFDLHQLFGQYQEAADWRGLIQLAEQTGFTRELGYALRYCQRFFDTAYPADVQQWLQTHQVTGLSLRFADWLFMRVLQPQHPLVTVSNANLARLLATVRGHWLKMPLHILLVHTLHKGWKGCLSLFRKDDNAHD